MTLKYSRIFALLSALPIVSVYLTEVMIYSMMNFLLKSYITILSFLLGFVIAMAPLVLEYKFKVKFSIVLLIILIVTSIISHVRFFTPIYSSFIFLLPLVWVVIPIVDHKRRCGLVVLNPVFPYTLSLFVWSALHLASFEYLGVVMFEVLKMQVRALVLPIKPLLLIYEPPLQSLILYPIAVVSSILYMVEARIYGWEGFSEYYQRIIKASRELFISALISIPTFTILSFIIPSRLNHILSFTLLISLTVYLGRKLLLR